MLSRIAIILGSLFPGTAHAGYYLYWRDGTATYLPDGLVLLLGVLVLAVCVGFLAACIEGTAPPSSSISKASLDLPEEVCEPDTVQHYDDVTARTRALKRKLDADTELAESYIKAARAKAKLEDPDDTLGENPVSWRARIRKI